MSKPKDYKPVILPIIKRILPKILAEEIVNGKLALREEVEKIEKERERERARRKE